MVVRDNNDLLRLFANQLFNFDESNVIFKFMKTQFLFKMYSALFYY